MKITKCLAALVVLITAAGCGGSQDSGAAKSESATKPKVMPKAKTFEISGALYGQAVDQAKDGATCEPRGDSDFDPTADVTVTGADGEIVGLGKLARGETFNDKEYGSFCRVPFRIIDVTDRGQFFTVQIGDLEPKRYKRAQLDKPLMFQFN